MYDYLNRKHGGFVRLKQGVQRRSLLFMFSAVGMSLCTQALTRPRDESNRCSDHMAWVVASLKRMLMIKPGMTRNELLSVFTVEGGISTALQRTFVSRDCPYFKVDVTFHRAGDLDSKTDRKDLITERGNDVIVTVSRPYLQLSTED